LVFRILRCSRSDSFLTGQSYVSVLIRRNERHCTDASCRRLWFVSFFSYCVLIRLPVLPVLERFFSRKERQTLFRSWAGSAGMWLKACIFYFPGLSNDLAEINRAVTLSGAMYLMPQTMIVTLLTVMENSLHSGMSLTLMTITPET
jgi:hypothetical protein